MRSRMTKAEAYAEWKAYRLPFVKSMYEKDGKRDIVARSEDWSNFVDELRTERKITKAQHETWTHPRECN